MAEWTSFRRAFGLRPDPQWIEQVVANPNSRNDTGIPLLPSEVEELAAAIRSTDAVVERLTWYGQQYPEEFGDVRLDGRTAVLFMTGDPAVHEERLARLLPTSAYYVVRQVDRSRAELEALARDVAAETPWFESVGAQLVEAHASLDRVRVRYRARQEEIAAAIADHFGDADWLELEWEGPIPWEGLRGSMLVTVVDEDGRPLSGAQCSWEPVDPAVDADTGLAYSTGDDGTCRNEYLPAVAYTVIISMYLDGEGLTEVGRGAGMVPEQGEGRTTVVIVD